MYIPKPMVHSEEEWTPLTLELILLKPCKSIGRTIDGYIGVDPKAIDLIHGIAFHGVFKDNETDILFTLDINSSDICNYDNSIRCIEIKFKDILFNQKDGIIKHKINGYKKGVIDISHFLRYLKIINLNRFESGNNNFSSFDIGEEISFRLVKNNTPNVINNNQKEIYFYIDFDENNRCVLKQSKEMLSIVKKEIHKNEDGIEYVKYVDAPYGHCNILDYSHSQNGYLYLRVNGATHDRVTGEITLKNTKLTMGEFEERFKVSIEKRSGDEMLYPWHTDKTKLYFYVIKDYPHPMVHLAVDISTIYYKGYHLGHEFQQYDSYEKGYYLAKNIIDAINKNKWCGKGDKANPILVLPPTDIPFIDDKLKTLYCGTDSTNVERLSFHEKNWSGDTNNKPINYNNKTQFIYHEQQSTRYKFSTYITTLSFQDIDELIDFYGKEDLLDILNQNNNSYINQNIFKEVESEVNKELENFKF